MAEQVTICAFYKRTMIRDPDNDIFLGWRYALLEAGVPLANPPMVGDMIVLRHDGKDDQFKVAVRRLELPVRGSVFWPADRAVAQSLTASILVEDCGALFHSEVDPDG